VFVVIVGAGGIVLEVIVGAGGIVDAGGIV
jgi:hypothetical protein